MKPIIGITADSTFINNRSYAELNKVNFSPRNLSKAVTIAGGIPVVIPVNEPAISRKYVEFIDGLILAGGQDISPTLYGEDARTTIKATYPKRDFAEVALAEEFISVGKPILGICRGLQLLNIIFGGTLYQDLSENSDIFVKHLQETASNHPIHSVRVNADRYMSTFLSHELDVNSFHHQIIRELGADLEIAATSSDGVIEAIEVMDENRSIVAVQWHPENLYYKDINHLALFDDLVLRAREFQPN